MEYEGLTDGIWREGDNQRIFELLLEFKNNPSTETECFDEIMSCIWEQGTCYPLFFHVVPYLIEIASSLTLEKSKNLWSFLGCWVSTHENYRNEVDGEVLKRFDQSLKNAERKCMEQLLGASEMYETDAMYLYASLFAFARHRFGYMTMSGYKDDIVGTSVSRCSKGHMKDVSVYDSGITDYEADEEAREIAYAGEAELSIEYPDNPWSMLDAKLQKTLQNESIAANIRSHLELASQIVKKGVMPSLPMKYAFSLCGSLLYCNGSIDLSMRILHGWDTVICPECGEVYVFADGWCDDMYFC